MYYFTWNNEVNMDFTTPCAVTMIIFSIGTYIVIWLLIRNEF